MRAKSNDLSSRDCSRRFMLSTTYHGTLTFFVPKNCARRVFRVTAGKRQDDTGVDVVLKDWLPWMRGKIKKEKLKTTR